MLEKSRSAILISNQSWQDILSLVPITVRSDRKLPVLIYHQEDNNIDIDASLHFLSSYLSKADDAAIVHVGRLPPAIQNILIPLLKQDCGITKDRVWQVPDIWTLQSLYTDVKTWVVVAHDDYESGLIAAPFAALKHAHLYFLDSETLEKYKAYKPFAKNLENLETVYLVGQIDEQVSTFIDSQAQTQLVDARDIQKQYLELTRRDKVILVNPNDLSLYYDEEPDETFPERTKGRGNICRLYSECSLVAPFLAAAKQEIIIPISSTDPDEIDRQLDREIADLGLDPAYLTIIASPEAIPMSIPERGDTAERVEIDNRYYGSESNWRDVDMAVGRIFGITVSDCSAYVARVLFFDELKPQKPQALFALLQVEAASSDARTLNTLCSQEDLKKHLDKYYWTPDVQKPFNCKPCCVYGDNGKLDADSEKRLESRYSEASLILYSGHGTYDGFQNTFGLGFMTTSKLIQNETYLNGFPVILAVGCSTGAYAWAKNKIEPAASSENKPKLAHLFVAQNIRRGAMAQQCAVGPSYWHQELDDLLTSLYEKGDSIGEAIRQAKNSERADFNACRLDNFTPYDGDPHYLLIGDPTFTPKDHMG